MTYANHSQLIWNVKSDFKEFLRPKWPVFLNFYRPKYDFHWPMSSWPPLVSSQKQWIFPEYKENNLWVCLSAFAWKFSGFQAPKKLHLSIRQVKCTSLSCMAYLIYSFSLLCSHRVKIVLFRNGMFILLCTTDHADFPSLTFSLLRPSHEGLLSYIGNVKDMSTSDCAFQSCNIFPEMSSILSQTLQSYMYWNRQRC